MPRKPRHYMAGVPTHILQHAKEGSSVFQSERDYVYYLSCLQHALLQHDCQLHAYMLLPDHVHLVITPNTASGVSGMMQSLNVRYARYGNRQYQNRGTVWQGRYRACLIEAERYLISLQCFLDQHVVREGIVSSADKYQWSSCRYFIGRTQSNILTPHEVFYSLGDTLQERQHVYSALVQNPVTTKIRDHIQTSLRTELPLGSREFRHHIESELNVDLGYATRGRPRKGPPLQIKH